MIWFASGVQKGIAYGLMVWLFTSMVMGVIPLMIEIAPGVIFLRIGQSLLMNLTSGVILGMVYW